MFLSRGNFDFLVGVFCGDQPFLYFSRGGILCFSPLAKLNWGGAFFKFF